MSPAPVKPASLLPEYPAGAADALNPAVDPVVDSAVAAVPADVRRTLKQVGRGNVGSRSLSRAEMQVLFGEILEEAIPELELGGLLIAFRMKGESVDEIAGALAALQARLSPVPVDPQKPVIAIPSYNGARRSANLTPLLAGLLADAGVQVIIHGVRQDPSRVTTCEVLQAMGHAPASSVAEAGISLERGNPAFVPIDVLCPPFARLLKLRERLGVRHVGHTLAKLVAPVDSARYGVEHCIRLMSYTHPEFNKLQHALMEGLGARAVVMRGSEGEAVAGTRRMVQMDWIEGGRTRTLSAGDLLPIGRPVTMPAAQDAVATAAYIQAALSGEQPVPENVARQVALILGAIDETSPATGQETAAQKTSRPRPK
ncbi:MAG: DNA-binding protein YbiB [Lautropia sp.]|nr:DNA-binding protein YbiB [Lautropia sp.]